MYLKMRAEYVLKNAPTIKLLTIKIVLIVVLLTSLPTKMSMYVSRASTIELSIQLLFVLITVKKLNLLELTDSIVRHLNSALAIVACFSIALLLLAVSALLNVIITKKINNVFLNVKVRN